MYTLKILLLVFLLPVALHAQPLTIKDKSGKIVNNDTLTAIADPTQKPPLIDIGIYLYVQNSSGAAINVGVKKTEFTLAANVNHGICFAGHCYVPTIFTSPNTVSLAAGNTDSGFAGHYIYNPATHTPSKDLVAYTFYNANNPADSAIVYVVYNTIKPTGVQALSSNALCTISPNPARQSTTINYNGKGKLHITDACGRQVYSTAFSQAATIDMAAWQPGIYFLQLHTSNGQLISKRIVKE